MYIMNLNICIYWVLMYKILYINYILIHIFVRYFYKIDSRDQNKHKSQDIIY